MKKGIIIVAALGLFAAVSCKKDHTCTCTASSTGAINFTISADTVYTDMKKKDAESACNTGDASYDDGTTTTTVECELK